MLKYILMVFMKRRVIINGKVHEVGYRPFLLGLAESLEIKRFFADNLLINGKQAVEILVDDREEKVKAFIKLVKERKPKLAEIEGIKIEEYKGEVMKKESYYRYLTAMELTKIANYGGGMLKKQDKMLEKQDRMLEKQDKMLKKQSETIKEIRITRREVKEEIRALRTDLKSYLDERLFKIEKEIAEIKAKIGLSP